VISAAAAVIQPRLNFGDCVAYALSTATGEALLYKGGDLALAGLAPI
jgi:uncharacterized protein with PIN domain